ncbi:MAG TPA: hypothetical protein VLB44_05805 [Kofleriaceae bacterium]|nr:hypothetical protein [Kofleriaceae bacterium]
MKYALTVLSLVAACGDDRGGGTPDAPVLAEVLPECHGVTQTEADPYMTPESIDAVVPNPLVPGTLAGWDPNGRWFLTGVRVGAVSSYFFDRRSDTQVIVDRNEDAPGVINNDYAFQREIVTSNGMAFTVIKRVSNRAADGSLRAERIVCDGDKCNVCTAKMVRATHNGSEGEGNNISLVGQLNPATWPKTYTLNVRMAGTIAYLVRRDGLHIIETADPANPVELGVYGRATPSGEANDVKLVQAGAKRYAIIADIPVDVVDVTDPANPAFVANIAEEAHTVAVESRDNKVYAYFGAYNARCPIYDVTDPTTPVKLGSFVTAGPLVHDLSLDNGIAYLNAWTGGFYVVDYTNPASPQQVGRWPFTAAQTSHSSWPMNVGGRHVALHGDENYGAHLDVIDVDPASNRFMSSIGSYVTRDHVSIHNLMAFGSKAYFTYYQDGVRVMDMSAPTTPTLVGYYNTWDPQADYTTSGFFEGAVGLDVDLTRKLIFVADSPRGLLILQDSTP